MGLEQIKIELLDSTGGDRSVVMAARVSFDKEPENYTEEQNAKLIKYLADHRHMTPFRHNFIQLRCEMPIFLARQMGKHQAGLTLNEVSRRYVDTPPEFYTPDEWRGRPDGSIKQGSGGVVDSLKMDGVVYTVKECYEDITYQTLTLYDVMLEQGVAPEMARIILPQSMQTTWIWSGNLLAFHHVYKERIAEGAQLEAKDFAQKLGVILEQLFPVSFKALKGEL
jgi:thymidylate synthase (FAD)